MSRSADDDDDEFRALFGDCVDADEIEQIKNHDPNRDTYCASFEDLADAAWERFGSYIAGNDYLRRMELSDCSLGAAMFRGVAAVKGGSLRGIIDLCCEENSGIDSTCFDLLLDAIDGGAIEILDVGYCSINNPMALARCTLPKLHTLRLNDNSITDIPSLAKLAHLQCLNLSFNYDLGEGAFHAIANLLREQDCSLKCLDVREAGMNDAGAIVLADALKRNNKLATLNVGGNDIGEKGMGAFLRLLNDVSSIKSTESSNHTITSLGFSEAEYRQMNASRDEFNYLECALNTNEYGYREAAGKVKVRETQLCARARETLCDLQGIECPSYHQLFSDLDAVLLPDVLQLMDRNNDERNELYPAIVAKASDIVSLINREAMLRGEKAKNDAKIASLSAQIAAINAKMAALQDANARIDTTLSSIELAGNGRSQLSGTKRSSDGVAEN